MTLTLDWEQHKCNKNVHYLLDLFWDEKFMSTGLMEQEIFVEE